MYLTDLRYLNGRLFLERCSNGYFFAKTYDTVMILMAWQIIQQRVYDTYSGKCINHAMGYFENVCWHMIDMNRIN